MKRALLVMLVALVAALTAGAHALAAPGQKRPARAVLVECQRGLQASERSMAVEARMRARAAGERLAVRFGLLQKRPGGRWQRVPAPELGQWHEADPGVTRYRYRQRIENLEAPGSYRLSVRFRWSDAEGEVRARARRTSPVCRQPDLRPDLAALRASVEPALDDRSRTYVLLVANQGRTASAPFEVALTLGGASQARRAVRALLPGERERVRITAPACQPGTPVAFAVDPQGSVAEADEADNARTIACPGA